MTADIGFIPAGQTSERFVDRRVGELWRDRRPDSTAYSALYDWLAPIKTFGAEGGDRSAEGADGSAEGGYDSAGNAASPDPADWPFRERNGDAVNDWNALLGPYLLGHVDDLLEEVSRVVFVPLDEVAARLPFELLRLPHGNTMLSDRALVCREPTRPQPLLEWRPGQGRFRSRLIAAGETDSQQRRLPAPEFEEAVGELTAGRAVRPPYRLTVSPGQLSLPDGAESLRDAVAAGHDVLVCAGYGERCATGLWQLRDGAIDSAVLADVLAEARPAAVVLAMCHSGDAGVDNEPSAAEALCGRGVPLTVGFCGQPSTDGLIQFTAEFMRSLGGRIEAGIGSSADPRAWVSTQGWLDAFAAGRLAMPSDERYMARLWLHPSLNSGALTRRVRRRDGEATVACRIWSTSSQLVVGRLGAVAVRVPLPHTGPGELVRLRSANGRLEIGGAQRLTDGDLRRLRSAWPAADGLQFGPRGRPTRDWGGRGSGELSAVLRALSELLSEPPPAEALAMLSQAAAEDWGSLDGRPRVLEIRTGRCVREFDRWPEVYLRPATERAVLTGAAAALPLDPLMNGLPDLAQTWSAVEAAFAENDGSAVVRLAGQRRRSVRTWLERAAMANLLNCFGNDTAESVTAVPALGWLSVGPVAGTEAGSGRRVGAPDSTDSLDVLDPLIVPNG